MNKELELSILKTVITNKRYALDFVLEDGKRFVSTELHAFLDPIIEFIKVYKDVPTKRVMLERLKYAGKDNQLKPFEELWDAIEKVPSDEKEYKHDLEKLKKSYSERIVLRLKDTLNTEAGKNLTKNFSDIQASLNTLKAINQTKVYKQGSIKEYVDDFKSFYAAKLKDPDFGAGIKSGYHFIDFCLGGLRKQELLLFAGTTNSGKSLLLINTAIQMWMGENTLDMSNHFKKGANVLLFSLEMNHTDYLQRALARIALVPQKDIRDATLTDEEKEKVSKAFRFFKNYPYNFYVIDVPRKITIEGIEALIDEYTAKYGKPDVISIDYLNLMEASSSNKEAQDWLLQATISEEVHSLARAKDIIILSAVQLNPKEAKGDKGEIGIKGLRRSTSIADNADFIIAINQRKNEKEYPDLELEFLKNRRGPLVSGTLQKNMTCCALLDTYVNTVNLDDQRLGSQ